jgi:Cys-rich repeat protein
MSKLSFCSALALAAFLAACGGNNNNNNNNGACNPACKSGEVCKSSVCVPAQGGCVKDADCSGATKKCETTSHLCVQCLSTADCPSGQACSPTTHSCAVTTCSGDADCAGDPTHPHCDTGAAGGAKCVECISSGQCPSSKPVCEADVCTAAKPCAGDADCATSANKFCDKSQNPAVCVQCLKSTDCPNGFTCDASHSCIPPKGCNSAADCADPTHPICDASKHCVACGPNAACPGTKKCNSGTGECSDCLVNADCADPAAPQCDTTTHVCEKCTSNVGCDGGKHCDIATGTCQNCTQDADCTGQDKFCDTTKHACVGCLTDPNCTNAAAPKCDPATQQCVTCLANGDCNAPTGVCSPTHTCVQCVAGTDCTGVAGKPQCDPSSYTCVECYDSAQCPTGKPVCDIATDHTCVVCTQDADCTGLASHCDLTTRAACYECLTTADCVYGGVCDTAGTHTCGQPGTCTKGSDCASGHCVTGACVQCEANADCPGNGVCSTTTHTCANPGFCTQNSDCTAGYICTGNTCVAAAACTPDSSEPNNALLTATPITPAVTLGTRSLCVNDPDWYVFSDNGTHGATATIHLGATTDQADAVLVWYDTQGTQNVVGSTRQGDNVVARAPTLTGAQGNRYFVAVFDKGTPVASYDVTVTLDAPACTDSAEPNDTAQTAAVIPPNQFTYPVFACGDDDWYAIKVPAGKRFAPVVVMPTTVPTPAMELFDATGAVSLGTLSKVTDAGFTYTNFDSYELASGATAAKGTDDTYLLKVTAGQSADGYAVYPAVDTDLSVCPGLTLPLNPSTSTATLTADGIVEPHSYGATGTTCKSAGPTTVYSVTTTQANETIIASISTNTPVSIWIDSGACGTGTQLNCGANDPLNTTTVATATAKNLAAGTYFVYVGAQTLGDHVQGGALTITAAVPPANMTCATAITMTLDAAGNGAASGTTIGANASYTSPNCGGTGPEVYYKVNIPLGADQYQADVTATSGNLMPVIDINGGSCASPSEAACGFTGGPTANARFPATGGTGAITYNLVVDGRSGSFGNFDLKVSKFVPAANDLCAGAKVIAVGGSDTSTTTTGNGDYDPGSSGCTGYTAAGYDVVYALTLNAGQGATITVTPGDSNFDPSLYAVTDCATLTTCVAGSDSGFNGDPETITIPAPASQTTYFVIVDSYNPGGGPFTITVQ